ncbi:hypothetical protein QE152_g28350 [Popillia japonica]|uniref:Uncharacterized protein n=1 Tax=Popillia japonica TaxID=7064 RepID=A0AAW1JK50_POPJA
MHNSERGHSYNLFRKDLRTSARMSPLLLKTSQTQDSSLTNIPDTEDSVMKISSMFPTVSDTHIRLLLKNLRMQYTPYGNSMRGCQIVQSAVLCYFRLII